MEGNQYAIQVANLSKYYKLYEKPIDRLKEALNPFGKIYHKNFAALHNITFQIKKGETVGIIGKNGSGKSTLLKMITGVLTPSSGSIQVNGNVSALLELGAGFNPDYTGLENVYLNGSIMGFSRVEMDRKMDDILSFADIGDFIHQPVKLYSSGMFVRLAFAVAINVDPDILIIDEALSVGDMRFQQKCYRKIEEFKQTKTVLFVSHDLSVVNKYCDRAIWINEGQLMDDNTPEVISKKYQAYMMGSALSKVAETITLDEITDAENLDKLKIFPLPEGLDILGDNKAQIIGISLLDYQSKEPISILTPNQKVQLIVSVVANEYIEEPIIGFSIKDRLGNIIAQSNSYVLDHFLEPLHPGKEYVYGFVFTFPPLSRGDYTISPAIASGTLEDHVQHNWVHDALVVQMLDNVKYQLSGIMSLDDVSFYQFG